MSALDIREVALRDGLQNEQPLPTQDKLKLLEAIVATGVTRIEATSFVSPKAVPALADAELIAAELHRWPEVTFSALVAGLGGLRRSLDAGVRQVEFVVSVSTAHNRANTGRETQEQMALIEPAARLVEEAGGRLEVILATAWDCPFQGRTPTDAVVRCAEEATAHGAHQLVLADTIGTTVPGRTQELIAAVRERSELPLGIHLHNTRGAAVANAWAAYQSGIRMMDASVGGLGGCPFAPGATGNVATEELVYAFEDSGISTGLNLDALLSATALTEQMMGRPLDSWLHRAHQRTLTNPQD